MSVWDELTVEQCAVMITALEEGYLRSVIFEYDVRTNAAPTLTDDAACALIPCFEEVVADLVERDWIELREPDAGQTWDTASPLTAAEIRALHDPDAWVWTNDESARAIWLLTTDRWDALFRT
ncbi:hypothetical protein [Catellatospora methionotrophica]|uniref:hypothetical protein n=1 Tax=Catellatospora methionotrophica TaxID=121620 RepID=UPI00140B2694|nr:hypothetical protein [Catellatospora methionotrophica]